MQDYETYSQEPDAQFILKSSWSFTREQPSGHETTKGEQQTSMELSSIMPFVDLLQSEQGNERKKATIRVNNLFPKLLRAGQTSETRSLDVTRNEINGELPKENVSVDLNLHRSRDGTMFWTFTVAEDSQPDYSLYVDK